ncbi:MAG: ester cyclase [Pseudomonadota bacterium]
MEGFDPRFKDFPDYIIGITKEIWEDRGVHRLQQYYAPDIIVRSPASVVVGNGNVIAATLATVAEFPDRELLAEDVIWSGTPEAGMLSSHRLYCTATHLGDGVYGKASGKTLAYHVIADCHARNNVIDDEWIVRDQGAIALQLGQTPEAYARDLIEREGGPENCIKPFTPDDDRPGPYRGKGNDNEWGARYADILTRIMNADVNVIFSAYDRGCVLHYPGGVIGHSFVAADRFWVPLRSAFPNATFKVEHKIGRDDPMMPPRAALRWSLTGRHEGWGAFGAPTQAHVHIMGMCHAEFGPWGLRREYVVYDETAVWKQIALAKG